MCSRLATGAGDDKLPEVDPLTSTEEEEPKSMLEVDLVDETAFASKFARSGCGADDCAATGFRTMGRCASSGDDACLLDSTAMVGSCSLVRCPRLRKKLCARLRPMNGEESVRGCLARVSGISWPGSGMLAAELFVDTSLIPSSASELAFGKGVWAGVRLSELPSHGDSSLDSRCVCDSLDDRCLGAVGT